VLEDIRKQFEKAGMVKEFTKIKKYYDRLPMKKRMEYANTPMRKGVFGPKGKTPEQNSQIQVNTANTQQK